MAIYYVRPTNGSDAAAGTTFGLAWQSTQYAIDNTLPGDEIRLCNEADETPLATINFATVAGTASTPILLTAGDAIDGTLLTSGFYTFSGSLLPALTDLMLFTINGAYIRFDRVRFTGATRHGLSSGSNIYYITLNKCRIDTNSSNGLSWFTTGGHVWLLESEIDSNTGQGLAVSSAGRGNFTVIGGSCHDNGGIGLQIGGDAESVVVDACEVYDNGGDGLQFLGNGGRLLNSTIYGNAGDGVNLANYNTNVFNTSSSNNAAYGFNIAVAGDDNLSMNYNHTYNNTSGASNITLPGDSNQTGDPQFASVTDGSEDFTPANGSPLDSNGINGVDIGARKAADPVGGAGGGCKMAGKSGGMVG